MTTVGDVSRHLGSGDVIFRQGDPGDQMFFVSEGRVSLRLGSRGHEHEIAVVEPGEFFGELALLHDAPRTATAVALADTTLLAVRRETFALMMNDDLNVVYRMLAALGRRLGKADEHIADLARRLRRSRLVAHVLGRCIAGHEPLTVDAPAVARALEVEVEDAEPVVRELAARGIGRLDGAGWHLDPPADAGRLAAALAADDRAVSSQRN